MGFVGEVEDGAWLTAVVDGEDGSRVGLQEGGHLVDKAGIVDVPEAPLGKRKRLARVSSVELFGGGPLGSAADVVEIVTDDVCGKRRLGSRPGRCFPAGRGSRSPVGSRSPAQEGSPRAARERVEGQAGPAER